MDALLETPCAADTLLEEANPECRRLRLLLNAYEMFLGHDLPNQLVSVQAYCKLLNELDSTLDEESRSLLTRLGALGKSMGQQTRRLATLGRLLREPALGVPVALEEAAREAIAAVRYGQAAQDEDSGPSDLKGITFAVDAGLPLLPVSGPLLHLVLVELVRNAVAAIGSAGIGRVDIGGAATPNGATIHVRDNGAGVSPERGAILANPAEVRGGGLLLVHQAAARWGGRLHVASAAGEGTTVTVSLILASNGVRE